MKILNAAADKIKHSPFIIPITLVFIVMFIDSVGLSIEDYSTSYWGYKSFPTAKVNIAWISILVGLLPQLIQIGLAYVWLEDTDKNRWALGIAGIAHLVDLTTDVWYKINIGNVLHYEYIPLALLESWAIYTLGSELMLTVSFGMILKLFPDFWRELSSFLVPVFGGIKRGFMWLVPVMNDNDKRNNNTNQVYIRKNEKSTYRPQYAGYDNESSFDNNDSSLDSIPIKRGRGRPRKETIRDDYSDLNNRESGGDEFNLEHALNNNIK